MTSRPPSRSTGFRVLVTVALGAAVLVDAVGDPVAAYDSPVADPGVGHVTADPLPTVQHNGVVWDQTVIGDRVYAVGEFTRARAAGMPPGVGETRRWNILAYDIHTGQLDPGFAPVLNAQARTITRSPDGSRLYVGGAFTTVNGVARERIAALHPATGQLIPGFHAGVSYRAKVLVATGSVLYVGGQFNSARGHPRANLAAFDATNGALLAWAPAADHDVGAMTLTPDRRKVIVGGRFGRLNGILARGTGALDATTGATLPWAMNNVLATYGDDAGFLELSTDGTAIYGNAYHFGGPTVKWEGVFSADPATGALNWVNDCHGDTYAHTVMNGYVFAVNHAHYCANLNGFPQTPNWSVHRRHATSMTTHSTGTLRPDIWGYASLPGVPSPSLVNWYPDWAIGDYTSAGEAGWTVEQTDEYLLIGGEFLGVNGIAQQGLVRFAVESIAPADQGPRVSGADFVPQLRSFARGQVRVGFRANLDRDDVALTYQIIRDNDVATPVFETTLRSTFWNRQPIGFTDTGLTPGSSHSYRIRAIDDDGNAVLGNNRTITVAGAGASSVYADVVMADRPTFHWRFEESSGVAENWVGDGRSDGAVGSGIVRRQPGAILGETSSSYRFPGSADARVYEPSTSRKPVIDRYSLEAWVRTTSNSGGRILGFSSSSTGLSAKTDRHLYMSTDGRVHFGVRHGDDPLVVSSPGSLNDGRWHHLVATGSDIGLRLFVDGALVAARSDALTGDGYYGYWRVGGDDLNDWPFAPSQVDLAAWIDEPAVYEHVALAPARVTAHYRASGRGGGNLPPLAAFVSDVDALQVAFDATGSVDPDGTIARYAWDFGDGRKVSGATASHTYAAPGTYTVRLTVTDDDGAADSEAHLVTVAANVAPIAFFTTSQTFLVVDVDADGSTDPDGSIVSYAWDFGDGAAATGRTSSHAYAVAGTYTIALTVTDHHGASAHTTRKVRVDPTNLSPIAELTAAPFFLELAVDASRSADPDGSIASYAWDFGDGATATGPAPSHTYAVAGSYTVTLVVTDDGGATAAARQAVIASAPARRLGSPVARSARYCFPAVGAKPGDVVGVNITPLNARANGNGALHSSDDPPPPTANVNFRPGSIDPNVAFAVVGRDGRICFTNSRHGPVDIVVDQLVVGESTVFSLPSATGAVRLADTRIGNGGTTLAALETRCVAASGTPGDVAAVNITPVNARTNGNGALHSSDDPPPATANVNFRFGSIDPNVAFATIGADGQICFTNSRRRPVDIVLDLLILADGAAFDRPTATGAARIADTRTGLGGTTIGANATRCVAVVGADPGDWAVVNLTPVLAHTSGNGALHSSDDPPPATANVNFRLGSIDPNVAFAEVGSDRRVCFTNSRHGPVEIVGDQLTVGSAGTFVAPTTRGAIRLTDTRLIRF